MRVLITGVAGFAGSHLSEHLLLSRGVDVAGVVRANTDLRHIASLRPALELFTGDVGDFGFVRETLDRWQPDYVFHLAAQAAPSLAWQRAQETLSVNIIGQYNILEAVSEVVPEAVVLVVGSADEYGLVCADELPVKESNALRPVSPYAVSKIAQDMLGYQFFLSKGVRAVRVRPFNHVGPRQTEAFVMASFASQIAAIEAGRCPPVLRVGNLDTKRDFCDVRDIVRAYWLAVERGQPGEVYNVGSGRSRSIADLLDLLLAEVRIEIEIERDPERMRSTDVPDIRCDPAKFHAQTGWQPDIPVERSMSDLLAYYRARHRGELEN